MIDLYLRLSLRISKQQHNYCPFVVGATATEAFIADREEWMKLLARYLGIEMPLNSFPFTSPDCGVAEANAILERIGTL